MRKHFTSSHNKIAHKLRSHFDLTWRVAFNWARSVSSEHSIVWVERPDSVFGVWCAHSVERMQEHFDALANGYVLTNDRFRARTFRHFADLLKEKSSESRAVTFSEVLALSGVGSGVISEIIEFYSCATRNGERAQTLRARTLALSIHQRFCAQGRRTENAWAIRVRDELMRKSSWRHLAVFGGGLVGERF